VTRSIRPTRSVRGKRRAAVLLAGAAAVALLAGGCSAGQIAETAIKKPAVPGINIDGPDNAIQLRNLVVAYGGPAGYPAGGSAPITGTIFNSTLEPITVRVTAVTEAAGDETVVTGQSVVLGSAEATPPASPEATPEATSTASPEATASPETAPSAPPAEGPAVFTVPAGGYVVFTESGQQVLRITGLSSALTPGKSVSLAFTYQYKGKQQELRATVPVTTPLSPAPRATDQAADVRGGH